MSCPGPDREVVDSVERYIRRIVAAAPPLTPEQRHRLAALLVPVAGREAEAA